MTTNGRKMITIAGETYALLIEDFEEDIDVDSLLQIDMTNFIGEVITFPVVVNRLGVLLADMDSSLSELKLNLEIQESKVRERLRLKKEQIGEKAPTVEMLNTAVISDGLYQTLKRNQIRKQKERDYINSIFWSAKDKSNKLDKLSLTVNVSDIPDSLIEGKINNVLIKKTKKLIPD
jgi:hypothetical protein